MKIFPLKTGIKSPLISLIDTEMKRLILTLTIFTLALGCAHPRLARAAAALELYPTFEAMGVIVTISPEDDPDGDMTASMEYRLSGVGPYLQGYPLTRITNTSFVGSLFWLNLAPSYDVRVQFEDPDGGLLDGTSIDATGSTRAEITIPPPTHIFYASPAGSGIVCALAAPCTLVEAVNQAEAGETVYLRDGVYATGEIDLPRSGTAGAPITLASYPGETAILDGGDPATFTWTARGEGFIMHGQRPRSPSHHRKWATPVPLPESI